MRPSWARLSGWPHRAFLTPAAFWSLQTYEDEPIVLDDWQIALLRCEARLRGLEKAPQVGFSFATALEALWQCIFYRDVLAGFVSVNMSEAQEKILVARKAYAELPEPIQRIAPLIKANEGELWFGDEARPSRMVSLPATSGLRGYKVTSVYLDEIDFYRDAGEATFRIMLGRIARGGRGTIGSTCFGVDTVLDKVCAAAEDLEEASLFATGRIPYWVTENVDSLQTAAIARATMAEEDFAEEYECIRGSTADSFSAEMIRAATHGEEEWWVDGEGLIWRGTGDGARSVTGGSELLAGYDVGQTRNPSVLTVLEHHPAGWVQRVVHLPRTADGGTPTLPEQHRRLEAMLAATPNLRLVVDAIGIGADLAQRLHGAFGERVLLMVAGESRPGELPRDRYSMAVELKRALEAGDLELVGDKEQAKQMQRTRLLPGHRVDQPGSRRKTHYDRFWALAYGWWGVRAGGRSNVYARRGLIVLGAKGVPGLDPGAEMRRTWDDGRRAAFCAVLVRRLLHRSEPIPWETLADEEASAVDALLARRERFYARRGDDVRVSVVTTERRRLGILRRAAAEEAAGVR